MLSVVTGCVEKSEQIIGDWEFYGLNDEKGTVYFSSAGGLEGGGQWLKQRGHTYQISFDGEGNGHLYLDYANPVVNMDFHYEITPEGLLLIRMNGKTEEMEYSIYKNSRYLSFGGTTFERISFEATGLEWVKPSQQVSVEIDSSPKLDMPISIESVEKETDQIVSSVKAGDIYTFGTYEQDLNSSNGKEPIKWKVLKTDGNRILVISLYALDVQKFNSEKVSTNWEACSLRRWLNGTFYSEAFTYEEKTRIPKVKVTAHKNPESSAFPGNDTEDYVFLLSIPEIQQYLKSDSDRMCQPTPFAKKKGIYSSANACWWWLRTPGGRTAYASFIDLEGIIKLGGSNVDYEEIGIRPALWIEP